LRGGLEAREELRPRQEEDAYRQADLEPWMPLRERGGRQRQGPCSPQVVHITVVALHGGAMTGMRHTRGHYGRRALSGAATGWGRAHSEG
jgi:hypothetical protein